MESCPRIFGMAKSMCNSIVHVSEEFQYHVIKMINVSSTKVAKIMPKHSFSFWFRWFIDFVFNAHARQCSRKLDIALSYSHWCSWGAGTRPDFYNFGKVVQPPVPWKTLRIFTYIQVTNEVFVLFYLLINVKTCWAIALIPFTVGWFCFLSISFSSIYGMS